MSAGTGDTDMKCGCAKPPRCGFYTARCHFSSILAMIADMVRGYLSLRARELGEPIVSGLQGTWRVIKQPDIFLVNHRQRGKFGERN